MIEKILVQLFEIILMIMASAGIVIILAATWHDLRTVSRKTRDRIINTNPLITKQPIVSILVYAHNDATTMRACLDSIVANDYQKYKIFVINNASTDTTIATVTNFKKSHPNIPVTIHTLKIPVDRHAALRIAGKKLMKSDFVFMIDATSILSPTAIRYSIAHLVANRRVAVLRIRRYHNNELTIKNLAEHFILLSRNTLQKALFWKSLTHRRLHYQGVVLRGAALTSITSTSKLPTAYSGAITYTSSTSSNCAGDMARSYWMTSAWIVALLACIGIVTYFFFTAATLQSNAFLMLSWILVSLWLITIVWSDETLIPSHKVGLTFSIPFAYFLLYVQLFATLSKAIRRLLVGVCVPRVSFKNIHSAIMQEAYSTRY